MIWRKLLFLSVVGLLLVASGCRSARSDNYMELLNAEKRALEDRIYDWEYEYEILEDELEDLRSENERLRRKVETNDFGPDVELPPGVSSGRDDSLPNIVPPTVEFGDPTDPPGVDEQGRNDARSRKPSAVPAVPDRRLMPNNARPSSAGPERVEPEELPSPRVADVNDRIEAIAIHPLHSQGADFDGKPGDDGLQVVLQPRNSANEYVPRPGPITLALLDPAKQGSEAVIGRWTFATEEAGRGLKRSGNQAGIHLNVAWADRTPETSRLRLFVRYETEDGRRIESQREVLLRLAHQTTAWTPRRSMAGQPAASVASRPGSTPPRQAPSAVSPIVREGSATAPSGEVSDNASGPQPVQPPTRPQWSPER